MFKMVPKLENNFESFALKRAAKRTLEETL